MPRAAIYARVSTPEQCLENQLYDLREMAARRGYEIVHEYTDVGSGSKTRRAGLDALLADAHRRRFDIVLVAAFDRVARSVKHFLTVVDELSDLGIEFVSARENIDTSGAMGRMFIVMVSSIAELERSLIVERIKAGLDLDLGEVEAHADEAVAVVDKHGVALEEHVLAKTTVPSAAAKTGVPPALIVGPHVGLPGWLAVVNPLHAEGLALGQRSGRHPKGQRKLHQPFLAHPDLA